MLFSSRYVPVVCPNLTRNWVFRVALFSALLLVLPLLAAAQDGTIIGTVTDASGGAIPDVAITITNTDTNIASHFTTNDVGQYVAPNLRIGNYMIRAESKNFKTAETKGIVLQVGDRRRIDFQLEVGTATAVVTVEAQAGSVAVQTDSSEISTVITGKQVTQLETNGRSLAALANLVPGASSAQRDFQLPTPMGGDNTISFNGQRVSHYLYLIDGGEAADRGGSGPIVMPSIDSLSEFRVLTSNYTAEYGLSSGATISTVIRGGTDQLHASAWWFGRNDWLDARNWFNPTPQPVGELRFNLWGFNVGGPVKFHKSSNPKTFFFYNMEWRRQVLGGGVNQIVPFPSTYGGDLTDAVNFNSTSALFNGGATYPLGVQAPYACQVSKAINDAFTAAGQALSGCTGGSPDPTQAKPFVYNGQTNVINPALLDPNAKALVAAGIFPAPTGTGSNADLFHGGQNAPTNVREEIVRIDHTFNSHFSIFGHFIDESLIEQTDVPARWAWVNLPTSSDVFGNPSYQAVVHLVNTINPSLVNEIGFNYGGNRINITPLGVFDADKAGFQQNRLFSGPNKILPQIFLLGKTGDVYNQNWSPWNNTADSYQIRDDVSWTRGSHQLKFGGSWLWFKKAQPLQDSPQGGFQFGGTYTGYDFADFLLGLSSNYSEAALKDTRHWNSVSWGLYVQDDWRATRRLTLNLGLRWDGIPHTAEVNGQHSNFYTNLWDAAGAAAAFAPGSGIGFANANGTQICSGVGIPNATCTGPNPFLAAGPNPALNGLLSYDNGLGIAGKNGIPKGLVDNHWNTFGPHIGFAYDVTGKGKTIVRAGFGTFFERIQGNDMYQSGANNLFGGNPSISNVSLLNPHIGIDPAGTVISAATLPVTVNGLTALDPKHYKIPTSYQYSAGIQQQLAQRTVLSVAYVGNQGRHMSYAEEINMPSLDLLPTFFDPATGNNAGTENLYRPYLGYGGIKRNQTGANSQYNSLQISLRSQFHDLTLQAAYTYSHAQDSADNALNGGDGGDLDYITNPYAGWKYDLGPSQYNRQNIAFVNFIYDVPFFRKSQNHFVKTVIAGWQVSAIITMESGQPLNLQVGGGVQSICGAVSGSCRIRPDLVGSISYPKNATSSTSNPNGTMQWFDPSAFAPNLLPGTTKVATFGNLKFDGVWGPGRDNWNIALFKRFAFTERLNFELRVESYNTWNHPQMNGVDSTTGDTDFGRVNSAYDPRVFQIGAKMVF
jgi:hypothetical protein